MSDERRASHGHGGDDELLRSLRELGAGYDPDVVAITRRLNGTRHIVHRPVERRPVEWGRPILLPAAAVLLVMGGIVLTAPGRDQPPRTVQPAAAVPIAPGTAEPTPSTAPPDGATASPTTAVGPGVSTSRAPAPTSTTSRAPKHPDGAAHPPSAATVTLETVAPSATQAVDLGDPGLLDWLAVGARADLKQVRAKNRAGAPLIRVEQPGPATSVTGPFRVSWADGVPEQDHQDAARWLNIPGQQAISVNISASDRARTVMLYAGASDARASLSISGKGITTGRTSIGSTSAQPRGLVITVSLPPTTGPVRLLLHSPEAEPTSQLYLSAVTVR